jgi:hypothetical protein
VSVPGMRDVSLVLEELQVDAEKPDEWVEDVYKRYMFKSIFPICVISIDCHD